MVRTHSEFPGVEWVEGTGEFIRIDAGKCTGCANCIRVCLAGCFAVTDGKARVVNLDACMECGACWYACVDGAIDFNWPRGGTGFRTSWG